jgi:hypothetical protein
MGGTQPSYSRIAARMEQQPGSVIEESRMPAGFPVSRDIKFWTRLELDAWLKHILDGQKGVIREENHFIWRLLPRPPKEPELPPRPVSFRCLEGHNVRWTPEELLFAERKRVAHVPGPARDDNWKGLPPARGSHVYAPYNVDLFTALRLIHEGHQGMREVLSEAAKMEELGPIHVRMPFNLHRWDELANTR